MTAPEGEFRFDLEQWGSMPLLTDSFADDVGLGGVMTSSVDPYEDCILWLFPEPGIAFLTFWMGADETRVASFDETILIRAFLLGVPYTVHHIPSQFQMAAVNSFLEQQWYAGTDPALKIVALDRVPAA